MPSDRFRIALSPHFSLASLLEYWATLEGRTVADLASRLLEEAVDAARESNRIPPIALRLVKEEMKQREMYLLRSHTQKICAMEKDQQEEVIDPLSPIAEGDKDEKHLLFVKAKGHFSDLYAISSEEVSR